MRAAQLDPGNIDLVAALLTTSRKTLIPQPTEKIVRDFYEIRDLLYDEEIRRRIPPLRGAGAEGR